MSVSGLKVIRMPRPANLLRIPAGQAAVRTLLSFPDNTAHPVSFAESIPTGRAPRANEYKEYIDQAEWPAVSYLHSKTARTGSPSDDASIATRKSSPAPPPSQEVKPRQSPRSKTSTWPVPGQHSPSAQQATLTRVDSWTSLANRTSQSSSAGGFSAHAHSRPEPIPRSGSPLAFNRRDRVIIERPGTPPWSSYPRDTAPASQHHQQLTRPIKSSSSGSSSQPLNKPSQSSSSQEDPTTPPRRPARDLPGSTSKPEKSRTSETYNVKSVRDTPLRQRTPPLNVEVATPRRTTVAMQSVNHPPPAKDEPTSRSRGGTITARTATTTARPTADTVLTPPTDTRRPAKDKIQPSTNYGDTIDRSTLSSEALARVNDLDRALAGMRFTTSAASSSASSSSGASTSSRRDSGTTTGGSSDFTDFLSDDSDYELQRQAEERAAQLQKARIERVDDKEFRDAQRGLEQMGLTESMGLKPAPVPQPHRSTNVPLGRAPGGFTAGTNTPQYQTVYLSRYH